MNAAIASAPVAGRRVLMAVASERPAYFLALDGLRGVAALAVVTRHMPDFFGGPPQQDSYLAVDLFFLLSGVVIAKAYETRLRGSMTALDFMGRRVIRLYPMLLLGVAFGLLNILFGNGDRQAAEHLGVSLLLALTFLPNPYFMFAFPVNRPVWSLFFELAANLFYAVSASRLSSRVLAVICGLCAVQLLIVGMVHGHLSMGYMAGSLSFGGWRVGYSFLLGVVLYRLYASGRLPKPAFSGSPLYLPGIVAAVILVLIAPSQGLAGTLFAIASVIIGFPLVVWAGMFATVQGRAAGLCRFAGAISYPVYAIHQPLSFLTAKLLKDHGLMVSGYKPFSALAFIACVVALAWLLERAYDAPLRKRLNGAWRALNSRGRREVPAQAATAAAD